ncbi:NUDIX hydrolase [Filifactor villosus]|uniref:NUDIX hydrolase n=1 Tax=Filifactor villosus TaxID=29374 RepID=A0ABV9QJ47_9FIRM
MMNKETTIDTKKVYTGKIVNLRVDTVEITGRGYAQRELISHRGGVCCVAITDENKILFVKQFRKAVEKELIELPAGTLEAGETPDQAVVREVREETGYAICDVRPVSEFYPTPGYSDEKGHLFVASATERGEMRPDADEDIEVLEFTLEEAIEKIERGEIVDAKTIMGIALYRLMRDK